jgi:hypothetical protein
MGSARRSGTNFAYTFVPFVPLMLAGTGIFDLLEGFNGDLPARNVELCIERARMYADV